jgi:hypothetical protein
MNSLNQPHSSPRDGNESPRPPTAPSDQISHDNAAVFMRIRDEWGFSVVKDPTLEEMDDCVWLVREATALVMNAAFFSSKNPIDPISPQAPNSGKHEFILQNRLKKITTRIWSQRGIRN